MQSRVITVLALLIALSFSFRSHAEVIKIAVFTDQNFHASMKQWQSTADYLADRLPQHVFQILPYSNQTDLETDLRKNKLDFLLADRNILSQFAAEFAIRPVLNTQSKLSPQTWTLARNNQVSYQLTYKISDALLKLPAHHKVIKNNAIKGWKLSEDTTIAVSSGQQLKRLYHTSVDLITTLFKQYWTILLACLISCLLILLYRLWDRYHTQQQINKHRKQSNDPSLSDTVY